MTVRVRTSAGEAGAVLAVVRGLGTAVDIDVDDDPGTGTGAVVDLDLVRHFVDCALSSTWPSTLGLTNTYVMVRRAGDLAVSQTFYPACRSDTARAWLRPQDLGWMPSPGEDDTDIVLVTDVSDGDGRDRLARQLVTAIVGMLGERHMSNAVLAAP